MADNENTNDRSPAVPAARKSAENPDYKSRLATMPLAVLLPTLGEVSSLYGVSERLERRHAALLAQAAQFSGEESEEKSKRAVEDSMLNQVLQWLSVGESVD